MILGESDSLFSAQNPKTEEIPAMAEIPDSGNGDSGFFKVGKIRRKNVKFRRSWDREFFIPELSFSVGLIESK